MAEIEGLTVGEDGRKRCAWGASTPDYAVYHDGEWGRPVDDDIRLFEKICLEGFQSGLSWLTILRKRENFRAAFAGFDFRKVARFGDKDVARLLGDAGIVRHRGKIESTINNARRAVEMVAEEGSLAAFVWRFEPDPKTRPKTARLGDAAGDAEDAGIDRPVEGPEEARLELRRPDDDVCLHAGRRRRQRPCRRLLLPGGGRASAEGLQAAGVSEA